MIGGVQQFNAAAAIWLDVLARASLQGGIALILAWCISRLLPRIPPAIKVWIWRIALLKLLIALCPISINVPILPASRIEIVAEDLPATVIHSEPAAAGTTILEKPRFAATSGIFALWCLGAIVGAGKLARHWMRARKLRKSLRLNC